MNWLKNNWQLKLLALALAIGLWLVIYLNPPVPLLPLGVSPQPPTAGTQPPNSFRR